MLKDLFRLGVSMEKKIYEAPTIEEVALLTDEIICSNDNDNETDIGDLIGDLTL